MRIFMKKSCFFNFSVLALALSLEMREIIILENYGMLGVDKGFFDTKNTLKMLKKFLQKYKSESKNVVIKTRDNNFAKEQK